MRTIRTKIYYFEELSAESQNKAIEQNSDINVMHDWWLDIYTDAKNIGLKITSFDLDQNKHAKGDFLMHAYDCATKITKNNGRNCASYDLAERYLSFYKNAVLIHSDGTDLEYIKEGEETYFYDYIEDTSNKFLEDILKIYAIILQLRFEYLQSEEAVKMTLVTNDYEFFSNGKFYSEWKN